MSYLLFPRPQQMAAPKSVIPKPKSVYLNLNDLAEAALLEEKSFINNIWNEKFKEVKKGQMLSAIYEEKTEPQGYLLSISTTEWKIEFSDSLGLYYGILTFFQIWEQSGSNGTMHELNIIDFPDILRRGILIDISRDKIPTRETLFEVIDMLSLMRINELQLYIQGYSYEYAGYEYMFPDETPIAKEEMKQITRYAKSKFITLIPNMNCLGHMDMWLEQMELKDLAECPEGFLFQNLYWRQPGTIDPYDEKSFDFVTGLMNDLAECFDGKVFNANLDEPYELGFGKSRAKAENISVAKVYVEYIEKINRYLGANGYEMMIWGDVIFKHPEVIPLLPKNITLLDWIYEGSATFKNHAKQVEREGFCYYVCPGTSAWCSLLGRSDNMKANIKDAADAAKTYHAHGIMTTDWGDMGHWQYLPVSYEGYAFTGAYGWNIQTEDETVFYFLNHSLFLDETNCFAQLLYKLGNYYLHEDVILFNTTFCFANITSKYRFDTFKEYGKKMKMLAALTNHIAEENDIPYNGFQDTMEGKKVVTYVGEVFAELDEIPISAKDAVLIKDELRNSVRMVCHAAALHHVMTQVYEKDRTKAKRIFSELYKDMLDIRKIHYELWVKRNKKGGFSRSSEQMLHLCKFYRKEMDSL